MKTNKAHYKETAILAVGIFLMVEKKQTEQKSHRKVWIIYAVLSAVFAALTSVLAKVGIEGVNSNLATAIRTGVVLVMSWGMVFLTNSQEGLADISRRSWGGCCLYLQARWQGRKHP